MLVNIHHDSKAEHRRLLVAGVAFLALLGLLLSFCVAVYAKVFESSTTVVVEAERAGLQLAKFGDVRMNGALVGQVRGIEQRDDVELVDLRPVLSQVEDCDGPLEGTLQLWPHRHGTDAMFMALLRRRLG